MSLFVQGAWYVVLESCFSTSHVYKLLESTDETTIIFPPPEPGLYRNSVKVCGMRKKMNHAPTKRVPVWVLTHAWGVDGGKVDLRIHINSGNWDAKQDQG